MALINTLLLTNDSQYAQRLTGYMGRWHENELRMMVLDSPHDIGNFIAASSVSVLLIDEECADVDLSPYSGIAYVYLSENGTGMKENSICKYSSGSDIYRTIFGLYSKISVNRNDSGCLQLYGFVNSSGGAGASSVAAAFAINQARSGHKVLYLCLDKRSPAISFFGKNTAGGLSELIAAVMSKQNTNLAAKAASLIHTDDSGVSYIQGCSLPNDYDEIDSAILTKLIDACAAAEKNLCIVVDGSLENSAFCGAVLTKLRMLVIVSRCGDMEFEKLSRTVEWLKVYGSRKNDDLLSRTRIAVNMVKVTGGQLGAPDRMIDGVKYAGVVPQYSNGSPKSIALAISRLPLNSEICR